MRFLFLTAGVVCCAPMQTSAADMLPQYGAGENPAATLWLREHGADANSAERP
jgi:hypothetical protein